MCLIVLAWRPGHALPLVVAANRDEFHERPSQPLGRWADAPQVLAGRDLLAGGTWMGITPAGRFAALTNIRAGGQPLGRRSRGKLVEDFLRGDDSPEGYLGELAGQLQDYTGFNLLVGDGQALWYLNSQQGAPQRLESGVHGLSNAGLNTPWPKLERALAAFRASLARPTAEALLELLGDRQQASDDRLPATGVPLEWERLLSSVFIASREYGTRSSTALLRQADGQLLMVERSFTPEGAHREVRLCLPAQAAG